MSPAAERAERPGPLAGTVILDLTTALSGPYATMLLAALGARVIKIENPRTAGDSSRNNSPYITDHGLSARRERPEDMSLSMMLRGRNKESVVLDLKVPAERETFLGLVRHADVVVENYSAGVTSRLGIDEATLRALKPELIYTSITGFGTQGGTEGLRAMDAIVQALSGIMYTAGEEGEAPVRLGLPLGDLTAPLFAVIGTLAAKLHRDRTGEGQFVDVSMLGALTSLVAIEPFEALEQFGIPQRTGAFVPRLAPFGTFATRDGFFSVSAPTDSMAAAVFAGMGRADLSEDPRFSTRDARVSHANELHGLMQDWAAEQDTDTAVADLAAAGAPVAPVRQPAAALRDPQVLARGEVVRLPTGDAVEEPVYGSGVPIVMSGIDVTLDRPAPHLGQDTEAVLQEFLGVSSPDALVPDAAVSGGAGR